MGTGQGIRPDHKESQLSPARDWAVDARFLITIAYALKLKGTHTAEALTHTRNTTTTNTPTQVK